MTYIKLLTALAGLALLTACGGGVSPTVNIGQVTINNGNPCATQPFGEDCGADYEPQRVKKIGECLMNNAAETPTCAPAVMTHSCIENPFTEDCTTNKDFADYIDDARTLRTDYCRANPDKTAFCAESVKFNDVCKDNTDIFNFLCSTDSAGRETACQTHGTGADGHASCATSLITACGITDPFAHAGCDDVAGIDDGVRTMYCQMPANIWNPKCIDGTHGTVNDRQITVCQTHGTGASGHATCATI
nr:hypothetical protein [Pseudomonadota bacterium]